MAEFEVSTALDYIGAGIASRQGALIVESARLPSLTQVDGRGDRRHVVRVPDVVYSLWHGSYSVYANSC